MSGIIWHIFTGSYFDKWQFIQKLSFFRKFKNISKFFFLLTFYTMNTFPGIMWKLSFDITASYQVKQKPIIRLF